MLNMTDRMADVERRLYLRPDARAIVDQWEAPDSRGSRRRVGIVRAIAGWWMFVDHLEDGYDRMMIDEYTNDLYKRDMIQRVLDMVPEGSTNILQLVSEYDDHLKRLTRTGGRNILAQVYRNPPDWWWWDRFPLSPNEDLRRWELPPPATET